MRIGIVAVGPGNVMNLYRGVLRAVGELGLEAEVELVYEPKDALFDGLFIPGVGHFGEGMKRLKENRLDSYIRRHVAGGRKIVGVCLGMQLLFEKSEEAPGIEGLRLLEGEVVRLKSIRLPHMGWNEVVFKRKDLPNGYYYFVHSYRVVCDEETVLGVTEYDGEIFPSAVSGNGVLGFQFHPEKSSKVGRELLKRVISCL